MRPLLLLALVACQAPEVPATSLDGTPLEGPLAAPTPADFVLEVGPMVAGDRVTLTVTDALPSAVIGFGFNDGSVGDGPCAPALFDRCLGLLPPVDLLPFQALTDASGNATVQVVLPAGLAGRTVGLQAAVLGAQGRPGRARGGLQRGHPSHPAGTRQRRRRRRLHRAGRRLRRRRPHRRARCLRSGG